MMMRTASEPNLSDASISPAIQAEIGDQCPHSLQPSTTEKRNHAEIGDGSPQPLPPPPPPEKRTCVEKSSGKQNLFEEYKAPVFDELPPSVQKRLQRFRDRFGPLWPRSHMESYRRSAEQIGEDSSLYDADSEQSMNSQDSAVKDITYCCSNPFEPLDFKGNDNYYREVRSFGEKAVADFNSMPKKMNLCFEDIESMKSCFSSCNHHIVRIKVVDPCDKISVLVLRGMVHGGFAEAKVEDFVCLGAYKDKS